MLFLGSFVWQTVLRDDPHGPHTVRWVSFCFPPRHGLRGPTCLIRVEIQRNVCAVHLFSAVNLIHPIVPSCITVVWAGQDGFGDGDRGGQRLPGIHVCLPIYHPYRLGDGQRSHANVPQVRPLHLPDECRHCLTPDSQGHVELARGLDPCEQLPGHRDGILVPPTRARELLLRMS